MSSAPPEPVAIIGASGSLGFGLAVRLAQAGVPVAIGSRDSGRARETAERAQAVIPSGSFSGHENADAVRAARALILSVPFRNHAETLASLKDTLAGGQLLIDATVPLAAAVGGRATRLVGVWQGSAAEQALEIVPDGVRVVSGLHTVSAASLTDLQHPLAQDVLLCGDSREDKHNAAQLIEQIDGLRCIDTGRLEMSRITESLTALLIGVNSRYKVHAGVQLTGMAERLWN